jgi:hypothetical protein
LTASPQDVLDYCEKEKMGFFALGADWRERARRVEQFDEDFSQQVT